MSHFGPRAIFPVWPEYSMAVSKKGRAHSSFKL
jgi:hypothetical protein